MGISGLTAVAASMCWMDSAEDKPAREDDDRVGHPSLQRGVRHVINLGLHNP